MFEIKSSYLFIGSDKLKQKVKKEIIQIHKENKKKNDLLNILEISEVAYPTPSLSSDINYQDFPKEKTDYIEELTVNICREIKNDVIFSNSVNEIDQFYQSIFHILSLAINRFYYAKQLNLFNKTILMPNVVKKKRPFSTLDIKLIDQQDEFNSFMLFQCIKSFSNFHDLKIINIKNNQFNIFEQTCYDHLNKKDKNFVFELRKFLNIINKLIISNQKIFLADSSFGIKEYIQYFGKYEFIDFKEAWIKLLKDYRNETEVKEINLIGKNFDLNNQLERYLKKILNLMLPYALINAPKYTGNIVKKTCKFPILSQYLFLYDDCLKTVLGQRKSKYNFLLDHGGSCFSEISYSGQFKYSDANYVTPSLANSGNIHLHKPTYIKAINPFINFYSFISLVKYYVDINLKNFLHKKPVALVIPKQIIIYNQQIGSNPQGYKEQLKNFESSTRLVEKLLDKGYFVLLKNHGNLRETLNDHLKRYSDIYDNCYFLKKSINLVDALNLADITFVTYPQTGLAQTFYQKKKTVLASPNNLWNINKKMEPLVSELINLGAYIDTSQENNFEVLTFSEYKNLFASEKVKKLVKKIYNLAFSYIEHGNKSFLK